MSFRSVHIGTCGIYTWQMPLIGAWHQIWKLREIDIWMKNFYLLVSLSVYQCRHLIKYRWGLIIIFMSLKILQATIESGPMCFYLQLMYITPHPPPPPPMLNPFTFALALALWFYRFASLILLRDKVYPRIYTFTAESIRVYDIFWHRIWPIVLKCIRTQHFLEIIL